MKEFDKWQKEFDTTQISGCGSHHFDKDKICPACNFERRKGWKAALEWAISRCWSAETIDDIRKELED